MADRKVYLCNVRLAKDDPVGAPFFNCGHHFDKLKETLDNRNAGATAEKITDVDNEACEHCLGDLYTRQFNKSRKRAQVILDSLSAESEQQTKNNSL